MTSEDWLIWADRVYFGAGAFAAIFTAITVVAGVVQNKLNNQISENKDREFAEFRIRSETRVKEVEGETALAKSEGQKANERAASLEEKAETLRSSNAQLAIQLEQERMSRIKLQNALSSRHITPEQAERISNTIRGKINQVTLHYTSEAKSLSFAQDIRDTLVKAGVQVNIQFSGVMSPTPYGLQMSIPENATSISEAFLNEGFTPIIRKSPNGMIVILVGQKPPPF